MGSLGIALAPWRWPFLQRLAPPNIPWVIFRKLTHGDRKTDLLSRKSPPILRKRDAVRGTDVRVRDRCESLSTNPTTHVSHNNIRRTVLLPLDDPAISRLAAANPKP